MKNVFLVLLAAILSFSVNAQEDSGPKKVYQFDIKQEIGAPIWRTTKMAMEEAHDIGADLIFINMNTYGGAATEDRDVHSWQEDARSDVFKWNRKYVFFTYGEN